MILRVESLGEMHYMYDVCCSLLQLLDKMESCLIPLISTIFEKGILGEGGKVEGRRQEVSPVYD